MDMDMDMDMICLELDAQSNKHGKWNQAEWGSLAISGTDSLEGLCFREYPSKIWPEIWYVYVPPSIGSWHSQYWEDNMFGFQIVSFHGMSWALFSFPPRWLGLELAVLVESKIECLVRSILLANYQGTTRSSSINNAADVWKYLDKLWL